MSFGHIAANLYGAPRRIKDWLYADNWSEFKLKQYEIGTHVPFVGDYMDYLLDVRADEEYLRRYNMTYADVHDPRKLKQVSSGSRMYGYTMNFVSKNFGKLYK